MSEQQKPLSNSENFTLHDFVDVTGDTLEQRVTPFSETLKEYSSRGWSLYSREVVSPPGPRVTVRDPLTGKLSSMIMMGSNDYLGFSNHPEVVQSVVETVQKVGVGMGGPPLLNGMSKLHRSLEAALANLKGQEDSLLFASGFQANLGWTYALLRQGDYVIYDELNHASFFDGIAAVKATRKIKAYSFSHNDVADLERLLEFAKKNKNPNAQVFVVVEGVYSMDGDLAPLPAICDVIEKFGVNLVVDDAHGTGVLGRKGGGASDFYGVSERIHLSLGTFSKSFGVTGGFIAAKKPVVDYLRFFSRSYLFSAHLPQTIVAAVLKGCELLKYKPELRDQLHRNVDAMLAGLRKLGLRVETQSAIIPIRIPEGVDLRIMNKLLHERGLFVNAIEYPAVSIDEQRIRLSLMASHTQADIEEALAILEQTAKEVKLL